MLPKPPRTFIEGPAGTLECVVEEPATGASSSTTSGVTTAATTPALAVVCHPHPLHGGTLDNKVAQTLARAFVQRGYRTVRFNFRGVEQSAGTWGEGPGEVQDALAVIRHFRALGQPLALAGFSFGAYVASQAAAHQLPDAPAHRLILVGPAVDTFPMAPVPAGTLIIQGETDDVVPLSSVLRWASQQALPVTVVPQAGHFFHGQLGLLKSLVLQAGTTSCATS